LPRASIEPADLVEELIGRQVDVEGIALASRANQGEVERCVARFVGEQVGVERATRRVAIFVRQRRTELQFDVVGQVSVSLMNSITGISIAESGGQTTTITLVGVDIFNSDIFNGSA